MEVQSVPGRPHPRVHGVEPQRDLRQLHRGPVEVDAVRVVEGDVRLGLLELARVLLRVDLLAPLLLRQLQIQLGQLVDRLVQERAGAESGLAHPPAQHLRRRDAGLLRFARVDAPLVVEAEAQRLLNRRPGQGLRCVVRGTGLPVPAGQPVHVRTDLVHHRVGQARLRVDGVLLDEDAVARRVRVQPAADLVGRDQPGPALRVATLGDLVHRLLGDETGVRHQALVHRAEVVDAEIGVADKPAPALALALDQGQVAQNLVQHLVAQAQVQGVVGAGEPSRRVGSG